MNVKKPVVITDLKAHVNQRRRYSIQVRDTFQIDRVRVRRQSPISTKRFSQNELVI